MGIKLSPNAIDRAHRVGRTYVRKNDVDEDESRSASDNDPRRVNIVNEEDGAGTASQSTSDQANGLQKGRLEQLMIVKFRSWKDRVLFYKNRKKLRSKKVRLDLTKRRFSLLKMAENQARSIPSVDFVFADINCRLTVRTKSGRFHHFNSQEQLLEILEDKFSEDDYSDD